MNRIVRAKDNEAARLFHWVSLAASDDKTRYFMNVVHVLEDAGAIRLVATDGRHLHTAIISQGQADYLGIEPTHDHAGIEVVKATKTQVEIGGLVDGQYPNWRKVLPVDTPVKTVSFPLQDKYTENPKPLDVITFINAYVMPIRLNPTYLEQALLMSPDKVQLWASEKAIQFVGDACVAVVMPMTLWKDPSESIA